MTHIMFDLQLIDMPRPVIYVSFDYHAGYCSYYSLCLIVTIPAHSKGKGPMLL